MSPYITKGNDWFGYDDEVSTQVKAEYILENDFAGGMFWSIDTDDFKGHCAASEEPFGLINKMKEVRKIKFHYLMSELLELYNCGSDSSF